MDLSEKGKQNRFSSMNLGDSEDGNICEIFISSSEKFEAHD